MMNFCFGHFGALFAKRICLPRLLTLYDLTHVMSPELFVLVSTLKAKSLSVLFIRADLCHIRVTKYAYTLTGRMTNSECLAVLQILIPSVYFPQAAYHVEGTA
jgi:hypothetical protein